ALAFEVSSATRAQSKASTANISFSLTQLRIGKDDLCLKRCRAIHAAAKLAGSELERYGISAAKLQSLSELINQFADTAKQTREIRSANKTITARVPAALGATDNILCHQL